MAKFSVSKFPAGLFDVTQDISRTLPVDVIERWTKGAQSQDAARQILQSSEAEGIVVSSDSVGLTRLSGRRGVLEILAMIDRPKQLVHGYGVAVGGEAIGIWAADNTEMFYAHGVEADDVVSMLLTTQDHIRKECEVQIGFGVHRGHFFRLGEGLYGADADRVETIAESYTAAGEIVVTAETAAQFGAERGFFLMPRVDLPPELGANLRITAGARRDDLRPEKTRYPIPFSEDFYKDLMRYASSPNDSKLLEEVHSTYSQRRAVVLIERERDETESREVAILNDLALSLAMKNIGAALLRDSGGKEIKTAGSIGIYTFEESSVALDFARRFRETLQQQEIASRIGIDYGDVLVFQLREGIEDIAGAAVNIASKLAQDEGVFGKISLTDAAARNARAGSGFNRVSFQISGVAIDAWMD